MPTLQCQAGSPNFVLGYLDKIKPKPKTLLSCLSGSQKGSIMKNVEVKKSHDTLPF